VFGTADEETTENVKTKAAKMKDGKVNFILSVDPFELCWSFGGKGPEGVFAITRSLVLIFEVRKEVSKQLYDINQV
jgi:hypothetical protein